MRIRTSVIGCAFLAASIGLVPSQQSSAAVVIDFSPDTTGAALRRCCFLSRFPRQYLGDEFTLPVATTIEGGSIFSGSFRGFVGDPVRFVILPDAGGLPGAVPVIDVLTTIDVVDTSLTTSQPALTRKHALIPPQALPAGTYWFYMAGDDVEIWQGTGVYDDDFLFFDALDANPDLRFSVSTRGDVFFTLEGSTGACLRSQGFWKTHPEDWPVDELELGTALYVQSQLEQILSQPVQGNGLVSLAKQLIAAKLNVASGAPVPPGVQDAIDCADVLIAVAGDLIPPIGDGFLPPNITEPCYLILDEYNNGLSPDGPPSCDLEEDDEEGDDEEGEED